MTGAADPKALRIVFLDRGSIGPSVELSKPGFPHEWVEHDRTHPDQVVERLRGADIAICNKVPIRRAQIEALPDLKMIAIPATGYDAFDIAACRERGIVVSNVRGYATNTVPEHTFALILALRRSIVGYRQAVIDGRWQDSGQFCFFDYPINDLAGSTLGIIGEGVIGQGVARIAQAFGMRTLFAAHKGVAGMGPLYTPFDELLATSDVITLHSPLMPATRNLIAEPEFRAMARRPLLINCSRGGLVHEGDLVRALDAGQIAGFGFDCLTSEPPVPENPLLGVLGRPNVIVTPHVAWASAEAMQTLWDQTISHIDNFHAGRPSNTLT
ncbi:MAG TPA: D-2-hydroxyacid dehydrogenase [Amaricoccus sp.]|uniref:D-2-hydroxyacid dehydrogenase n=1 Tax=Amaricoccus sp. TaxID=1872485 RepID=UPI001DF0094D|nr:D-2-hydroxyacid dehydrogenase [Amaricoccus sp.]MCC0067284.1 D-2-hydroxyacid dehydrogenase [Rhodovulum sp.]HPG23119.1 D-2-hydroxyacid dehydrogenase [Amaricoccus sp.]HRW14949.1 D-2-hydroxyacid dehydrogenase [Amaricoccus sp.]